MTLHQPIVRKIENEYNTYRVTYHPDDICWIRATVDTLRSNGWTIGKKALSTDEVKVCAMDYLIEATKKVSDLVLSLRLKNGTSYEGKWELSLNWRFDFQTYMDRYLKTWPKGLKATCVDAEDYGGIIFGGDITLREEEIIQVAIGDIERTLRKYCEDFKKRLA